MPKMCFFLVFLALKICGYRIRHFREWWHYTLKWSPNATYSTWECEWTKKQRQITEMFSAYHKCVRSKFRRNRNSSVFFLCVLKWIGRQLQFQTVVGWLLGWVSTFMNLDKGSAGQMVGVIMMKCIHFHWAYNWWRVHTRCFVLLVVARRPTSIKTRNKNASVLFSFKKHITDLQNARRTHTVAIIAVVPVVHLISRN